MYICMCVLVAQLGPPLCELMDCSPTGSSVHGILQARILEWIAIPFSRGCFWTQGSNLGLLHCRQILYHLSHQQSPLVTLWTLVNFFVWSKKVEIFTCPPRALGQSIKMGRYSQYFPKMLT